MLKSPRCRNSKAPEASPFNGLTKSLFAVNTESGYILTSTARKLRTRSHSERNSTTIAVA